MPVKVNRKMADDMENILTVKQIADRLEIRRTAIDMSLRAKGSPKPFDYVLSGTNKSFRYNFDEVVKHLREYRCPRSRLVNQMRNDNLDYVPLAVSEKMLPVSALWTMKE